MQKEFQAIQSTFSFFYKKPKKTDRERPPIFFYPKSYFLCDLKPHAKFRNPTMTPSGRKVARRIEEERQITPLIVDT